MPPRAEDPTGAEEEQGGGLRIAVARAGPARVVTVAGELDHDSADSLRPVLAGPAEDGVERIVVDLAGLRFCDSTGLNILLHARIEAEATGLRLELASLRPIVARLFAITGADTVLRIHPDLRAALASADGPSDDAGETPGSA
ncbi:STAS domain-containing protein [Kitasatospora sp. NPDC001539]|uniref:STAS domain-containing protein n=1 Tax=Kitasatospora sp. NPDC001539 TaxID=3154384 RepID=UPI00332001F9